MNEPVAYLLRVVNEKGRNVWVMFDAERLLRSSPTESYRKFHARWRGDGPYPHITRWTGIIDEAKARSIIDDTRARWVEEKSQAARARTGPLTLYPNLTLPAYFEFRGRPVKIERPMWSPEQLVNGQWEPVNGAEVTHEGYRLKPEEFDKMVAEAFGAAYLDPKRFPVTTQKGLNFNEQRLIDSHNASELQEWEDEGNPLNDRQKAIKAEFAEKIKLLKQNADVAS